MDATMLPLAIIGVFGVVVIAALLVYRQRSKFGITGPAGTGVTFEGSNPTAPAPPGVRVADATSRSGGLTAHDETGHGADVQRIAVDKDIDVRATDAAAGSPHDPKARS